MKIVHLTDTYAPVVGGIERQVERLATLQAEQGHEVVVVAGRFDRGRTASREGGVLVRRPSRSLPYGRALPWHPDDLDADVFHAHLSVLSPGTLRAAAMVHAMGLPLAVTVHSMWSAATVVPRALVRVAGLDSERVAWSAVSTVAARQVGRALSDRRVDVVPNAVDVAWWTASPHSRPAHTVTAVLVGRLARRKRVVPLVRALSTDWPQSLRVVIVGDGPQRAALGRTIRRAGLADRVAVIGGQDPERIRALLHRDADLFVAPSALESFGIAALEARAAGIPVLAREGTGVADFVRHGVDGWLSTSDRGLAAAVAALARAPQERCMMQRAAAATPPVVDQAAAVESAERLYLRARAVVRADVPSVRPDRTPPVAVASRWPTA